MSKLPLQPIDIAREALRRLALERTPPTPDNFRSAYAQIVGDTLSEPFPRAELIEIAATLPQDTPERQRLARRLTSAAEHADWGGIRATLAGIFEALPATQPSWPDLLRDLILQLDTPHQHLTRARKLASLDHILRANARQPETLFNRLQGLVGGWGQEPLADRINPWNDEEETPAHAGEDRRRPPGVPDAAQILPASFGTWLGLLLRNGIAPLVGEESPLAREAVSLAEAIETADEDAADLDQIALRLRALEAKLEWAGEDQRAIRSSLLNLLRLIVANIGELVIDDQWLHGQVSALGQLFERPLDIRALDELERRLRDVIDKQRHLKRQLTDAQERLKSMLGGFVDRLVGLSQSTGRYQETLTECAERIRGANDVSELSMVVETLLERTQEVNETARQSSAEIGALREQVEAANSLITRLQRELDETSELVRYDPLTGVLNRKGLDEAIAREIARARRQSSMLCIGVLDLDNFKQLNDTFGHRTGDEALRHLADVARASLRQQDVIGRLGGEEFLVLLPDADEEQAAEIMTRLQRSLTKHLFMADNRRVLITFSAGIARIGDTESAPQAIDRADKAMYAAKRAGKNRVLVAA